MRRSPRAITSMSFAALCALLFITAAVQATDAQQRKQGRALPDWSGLWESNIDFAHVKFPVWPYNSEWQRKAEQIMASQDSHFYCTEGMPSTMQIPDTINMFEVLIQPKLTVMIFSNHEVRHIYTDGRRHPGADELWPTPEGDSIGHWQNDTLIVDTIATRPQVMQVKPVELDPGNVVPVSVQNTPTSDQLHITERIRLLKGGILEDQMTEEDPVAFSHPYQSTFTFKRLTDLNRMVYEDCDENPRDFIKDGKAIMVERP